MNKNRMWTDNEAEALMCLRTDGKNFIEIAKKLGRTPQSVRGKWHGIKRQTGKNLVNNCWSKEEEDLLFGLAESLPKNRLLTAYNNAASKKGFLKRSLPAIISRLHVLGQSAKPQVGWNSVEAIAIGLGFSREKVQRWLDIGKLKFTKEGSYFYVKNSHLIKFIVEHPTSLNGLSPDGLQWFLCVLRDQQKEGE